jgi:hippurate hydrolase
MGSEDFSYMLQARPGCYLRLGQGAEDRAGAFLHNTRYDFNDAVIPLGAALMAALAERGMVPAAPAATTGAPQPSVTAFSPRAD